MRDHVGAWRAALGGGAPRRMVYGAAGCQMPARSASGSSPDSFRLAVSGLADPLL